MSWSKRQLVMAALEELGIASYSFDLSSEQLESGLRRLDTMMGEWNARGVRIGYALASSPATSDLDQDSGLPDSATEAVITNLAIRLGPQYGKAVAIETKAGARGALNVLLAKCSRIIEKQPSANLPVGAGQKTPRAPFVPAPTDALEAGTDSQIITE
jgi:hypothetical protein